MSIASRAEAPAEPEAAQAYPAAAWQRAGFWYYAAAVNAGLIAGFWWFSSGHDMVRSGADFFNGLGRITGLEGTYLVLWQLALMARVRWFDEAVGMERLAVLHRLNGYLSLTLLLAHAAFQTVGYMLGDGYSVSGQVADFVVNYEGLLAAIVALVLIIAVAGGSIVVARAHLAYETWYFIHLYAYIAVLLAFSHQLATGIDFIGQPIFTAYWVGLYLLLIAAVAWFRVAAPLVAYNRHRFRVHRVAREGPGVHSVHVRGRGLDRFQVRPGQFLVWRFLDGKRWWQAHPFSLSAPPDGRELRLTVKGVGDFSGRIAALRPGTPVILEGPFGKLVDSAEEAGPALLVAGGIGITPLRAIAETMARRGRDVRLLYRATRDSDLVFKAELDRLAETLGVRVDYLLTEGRERRPRADWFRPETVLALVPDIARREVFLCGPPEMMFEVTASLAKVGVRPDQIHAEVFRY